MRIELWDTFNNCRISCHNNIINAVMAQRKHSVAVVKANGINSYLTYAFLYPNGNSVDDELITEIKLKLDN